MPKNILLHNALRLTVIPLLFILFQAGIIRAESAEEKGLAIAIEADRRDSGYEDSTAAMLMILRNRHGQESRRELRYRTLEVKNDGDMSLTIFDSPKDVKGTAFLNYTHKIGDDDQWLYLPALKSVKRISSSNKSGSFMGSEFAYEDIASQEVEKYTYKWLRDEIFDNRECFVLERYPVDMKNSGYSRQVVWIGKDEFRIWQVEYYDRKNTHLKTLTFSGYRKHNDSFWRPDRMFMINHQTGKNTELQFSDYRFKVGLSPDDFNKNSLKRAK
ncbi:MAG: outer membrane lipoprotein-sorting protein [Deltaproteobacteria bacterium]|jgi:outer membrane lipoprotein-sorting protein|nr:outer membrane lipoprotein-sorting protein [Deltaproteobacteria bacterium]